MTFEAHLERNLLLVFVDDRDSQSEADNNEVDTRARCGEWRDPASLTTTLISDPGAASASNSLRFPHSRRGVICECIEILRVFACRLAGSAFVIHEGANILGRYQSLECLPLSCGFLFRTVKKNLDRNRIIALRQH